MTVTAVRDLDLELEAFEGPLDLLLTLVLKEELALSDVQVADVVVTFVEQRAGSGLTQTDLELCGEFLVLVAALLELKGRLLLSEDDELDIDELDADEAAAELAERLAEYRRVKAGAAWLEERLAAEADRFFRTGPAPLAPVAPRPLATQDPAKLESALRALAAEPPAPSLSHLGLRFPPVSLFLERFRAVLARRTRFVFDEEVEELSRVEQAVAFLALLELRKTGRDQARPGRALRADHRCRGAGGTAVGCRRLGPARRSPSSRVRGAVPPTARIGCAGRMGDAAAEARSMRQLYLVDNPVDRVARNLEALLVVASSPLSIDELADAAAADRERVETALGILASRYREGRSGIVLEQVAGGFAFRAAREAADACARLVERPVQRGLSPAALETLAIIAYLGPVSRPEIARIRGVASDSAVAGLADRGLVAEAGRDGEGGAIRYRTTPLFERVFGLTSLAELPALDDLAGDAEDLRVRLESVADRRGA